MDAIKIDRYQFTLTEVVETLIGDRRPLSVKIDMGLLVIDLLAHEEYPPQEPPEIEEAPPPSEEPPERKGGELARKAGILCNHGAFRKFLGTATLEATKAEIYARCGIKSRVDLDYDEVAAARFREIVADYDHWYEHGE